ncbi:MAG: hypothetical protein EBX04_13515 [Rhodobacteraceae bacterium]|nr:hypothetical protein [Paracoccaceae bacterium]
MGLRTRGRSGRDFGLHPHQNHVDKYIRCADAKSVCDALRLCAIVGFWHVFNATGRHYDTSFPQVIHEQNNHRTRKTD